MLIPLASLISFNEFKTPDLYYSFENGFENSFAPDTELISYGNMAFTDHAPSGKGLDLQNGFLNVNGSDKFRIKDSFTFSCWLKFKSLDAKTPMIFSRASKYGDPYNGPFSISFSEDFKKLSCHLAFEMPNGAEQSVTITSGEVFNPARLTRRWHHVAVAFNKNFLCFYIDGKLSSTHVIPKELASYKSIANTDRYFSFGRCLNTNMNAYLDEIHFYTEYMDYDKMIAIYSQGKPQTDTEIILTLNEPSARINGKEFTLSAPVISDEQNEDYLVPAKSVLPHIGGTLAWDNTDGLGRADIKVGQTSVSLWAYDTHAVINGNYYKFKTHPRLTEDNVLLIPVSLFSDTFGADVEFKESLSQLSIIY